MTVIVVFQTPDRESALRPLKEMCCIGIVSDFVISQGKHQTSDSQPAVINLHLQLGF